MKQEKNFSILDELKVINQISHTTFLPKDVYIFKIKLCDNNIDKDWERFTSATLEELAKLFIGKCGIIDTDHFLASQQPRVYRTEVISVPHKYTLNGEQYQYLKGWAYIPRIGNEQLIAKIESGAKKEVSIGCSIGQISCSICGCDLIDCKHEKGKEYDGKQCFGNLEKVMDVYEWAFVAELSIKD